MADDNDQSNEQTNPQLEFDFPSPEDFVSYDDVDSDEGQAELPADNFDESAASDDEEGCACVR